MSACEQCGCCYGDDAFDGAALGSGYEECACPRTADGVLAQPAMTVYAVSPWNEIETLYVEHGLERASTIFPYDPSAAHCSFPTDKCYADKEAAEAAANTPA